MMKALTSVALGVVCSLTAATLADDNTPPAGGILQVTTRTVDAQGEWPMATTFGPNGAEADCWWDNGAPDGVNAQASQTLGNFNARTADDFILEAGKWHLVKDIRVCMAVSVNVVLPDTALEIYADCNGRPDTLNATIPNDPLQTRVISQGAPYAGFNLVEFVYPVPRFILGDLSGCDRVWISPYGIGTGTYFWATANRGIIQGVQGHFRASALGYPDWTPVSDIVNFAYCTDFCFRVCGCVAHTIKDQCAYDLDGLESIKFPNIEIDGARAADNFQISSHQTAVEVCRLEAYLATNCDPTRVFAEIYTNNCDLPGGVLYTLRDPLVILIDGVFFDGLQVYCFRFDCPSGIILQGGNNYWLSLAATSSGGIFDRAVFLFHTKNDQCDDIHISEGVYRNSFAGFDAFTPVSHEDLANEAREFAFCLYARPVACPAAAEPGRLVPGDTNLDGSVNFNDILDVLRNWGATASN